MLPIRVEEPSGERFELALEQFDYGMGRPELRELEDGKFTWKSGYTRQQPAANKAYLDSSRKAFFVNGADSERKRKDDLRSVQKSVHSSVPKRYDTGGAHG